ncbi:MAG: hypothetical protein QM731_06825 [Chitinophagaceae bacterium]
MVYKYVVTLRNQHSRSIDILGILLSAFSVLLFTREMLVAHTPSLAYLFGVIFIIAVLAWNLYQARKGKKVYYSRALLIAALVWMKMPYFQWLLFVYIALAFLEYQAKSALEIGFTDEEVVVNSLFKRRYLWKQFNNIVLKDGLLTLDFTNNRILQREVEDDEEDDADEDEFNDYCRQQLANVLI